MPTQIAYAAIRRDSDKSEFVDTRTIVETTDRHWGRIRRAHPASWDMVFPVLRYAEVTISWDVEQEE